MRTAKIFIAKKGGQFMAAVHCGGKIQVCGPLPVQVRVVGVGVFLAGGMGADRVELVDNSEKLKVAIRCFCSACKEEIKTLEVEPAGKAEK